jgi:resolvase-like protein
MPNIGYARCSTLAPDLTAQRQALAALGVPPDRVYLDKGLTGTSRTRPGLDQALAAVREGDTLTVTKLDRLARSVPDALDILGQLSARGVRVALGGSVHDWNDPFARMFLQILAVIAEFEAKPHPPAHPRGHGHRPPERRAPRQAARPQGRPGPRDPPHARQRRLQHRRDRRPVQRQQANRVPVPGAHHQPAPAPRGTRPAPDVAKYGQLLTRRPN